MARKKKTEFKGYKFVGKGEEDIRDLIKMQFIEYVNAQKGYPYLGLKKSKKSE